MSDNTKYATIPGFEQLTAQQVFDMSASHLLKQMEKSSFNDRPHSLCAYRGRNGLKCAAGVFLTDEGAPECDDYDNCGEGSGWSELVSAGLVPDTNWILIQELQKLHDECDPRYWRDRLIDLAAANSLDDSVCR